MATQRPSRSGLVRLLVELCSHTLSQSLFSFFECLSIALILSYDVGLFKPFSFVYRQSIQLSILITFYVTYFSASWSDVILYVGCSVGPLDLEVGTWN